jgi:hypothetical protein
MFLAKLLPGARPIITEVDDFMELPSSNGRFVKVPREPWARRIKGGGAAALSASVSAAIASAKCVLEQRKIELEVSSKRDRW